MDGWTDPPILNLLEASGGRSQVREQPHSRRRPGSSPDPGAPSYCAWPGSARGRREGGSFGAGTGVPGARVAGGRLNWPDRGGGRGRGGPAGGSGGGGMAGRRVNVNVGVLGHIDSGKTALARALSTTASTAAFDKQPQSRERGITLDLGFSCFSVPLPARLRSALPEPPAASGAEPEPGEPQLQVTLVDCPGHASLIRTIIGGSERRTGLAQGPARQGSGGSGTRTGGPLTWKLFPPSTTAQEGAQIIDLMMLVIDVTKGMQTQSAECLVIGQIACQKLVVVLNKIDLLAEGKRQAAIDKMTKKMQKTLENTKFRGAPIIPVAAKPGGPEAPETEAPQGISELIELLTSQISIPTRDPSGPLLMSVDHCFSIKGQGTVMTGTILSGSISLGDSVEIPALKVMDDHSVIGRSLFKKETNIQLFVGLKVSLSTGELGVIDSAFGQSGKFKIHIPGGLSPESKKILTSTLKKRGRAGRGEAAKQEEGAARPEPAQHVALSLSFKRYVFDTHKRMVQSP
uniref:Eukaryotic elongation factor, selenocysteine-tRNA specific n=1 Tax=Ailuropoda melanoleuca TaxID=9646 RepID=A0A7N5P071_AILME